MHQKKSSIFRQLAKWVGVCILCLFLLVVVSILAIRTPWAQQYITEKAAAFVSEKTQTVFSVQKLFITFRGDIQLEGVYLEDQKHDTLVYLGQLEAGLAFLPLLDGNINISRINSNGLVAKVNRSRDSIFNFDFLIDAFSGNAETDTLEKADSPLPNIGVGPIHFTDFKLSYRDEVLGVDAKLKLGMLNLSTDQIDLNTMAFKVDELALENVTMDATQWLASTPSEEDTSSSTLPFISCHQLSLKNVKLSYRSTVDKLVASTDLGQLNLSNAVVNLMAQNISADELSLKNTMAFVQLPASTPKDTSAAPSPFVWPEWKLKLKRLELANDAVELNIGSEAQTPDQFNSSDMRIKDLQLLVEDIELSDRIAKLDVKHISLNEKSGFVLNQLAFFAEMDDEQLVVRNLNIKTPFNLLQTDLNLSYQAIDSLIQNPLSIGFDLNLAHADLSIQDAYFFAAKLRTDTLIQRFSGYPLSLSGNVSGNMQAISIEHLKLRGLRSLNLSLDGTIKGLPDTNSVLVDIPNLRLSLTKHDVAVFLSDSAQTASIPDTMLLLANVKGGVKELIAKLDLKTEKGNVNLSANLKNLLSVPSANGTLRLTNIDVAKLAAVKDLAPVSLTLDFDAAGNALDNLSADLDFTFQQLAFKDYDYSDLKLSVSAANQKANVAAKLRDENLDFDLSLDAVLDTLNPVADLVLNLKGINLYALGFSAEDFKIGADLNASYSGPLNAFNSSVQISNGLVVKQNELFRVRPIEVTLNNSVKLTELTVSSEIVNGKLTANTSVDSIVGALATYLKSMTSTDSLRAGIMNDSLDVTAHFSVNNSRLLTEALLPKLTRLDTIHLDLEFHPSKNKLDLNLSLPKLVYDNFSLDSLGLFATANGDDLKGTLAFRKLDGGVVNMHRTRLDFGMKDQRADLKLAVADSLGATLASIGTNIDFSTETTLISFMPNDFVLNNEPWNISADNQISIAEAGAVFRSMDFSNAAQHVRLENLKSGSTNGMKVSFDGFELVSLTSIANANDSILSGALNGTVRLINLNSNLGIDADIRLNQLAVMGMDMGQLKLLINNKEKDVYKLDLSVKGNAIDLAVKGSLVSAEEVALDLKADLNRLDVRLIEGFTANQIKNASGSIEAHTTIKGPISDIRYDGSVAFNGAMFTVTQLNARFTLPNDKVAVSNEGLVFNSFKVIDENGDKISVDGKVGTSNLLDPSFDLHLVANNFQPLHSTREDNDLYYGKAFLDADVKLTGSLSLPRVKARANLLKGTDITFIVPESEAAIEERNGLVSFANMKDTLNVILRLERKEKEISAFKGIDLIGYIEVDRSTKFTIVIDERSGDQLEIEGEAKLNAEMTPNGIITLSGNYEVESGYYKMNFYGLAKRKFDLVSGSRIVWSGDPLAGELDLKAKYTLKTSASDLMTDQLAQSDATTLTKYKQALPFEVMLNINGELLKPEISFGIDMPASARQALDGNVYKRVRQLNANASELDKQVFSLIVLNRFLPQSFDQMDGSGSQNMARSSASKLLSGQLNALSSKYLKGVELNFDLNSYTDYQSGVADDKTQLDVNIRKALFNDRVVVQVGGQVDLEGKNKSYGADDILGDISLEYLITKEGDYRLKAFRKNEFQDLVQGQVVVMGLSVMFNKSFNDWQELLRKKPKDVEAESIEEEIEDLKKTE